jgi:hypothetical protein
VAPSGARPLATPSLGRQNDGKSENDKNDAIRDYGMKYVFLVNKIGKIFPML